MANQRRICSRVSRRFQPNTNWACQGRYHPKLHSWVGSSQGALRSCQMQNSRVIEDWIPGCSVPLFMGSSFGRHPFCSIRVDMSMSLYIGGLTLECQGELVMLKTGISNKELTQPCWVWWSHFCHFRETYCRPLGRPQYWAGNIRTPFMLQSRVLQSWSIVT